MKKQDKLIDITDEKDVLTISQEYHNYAIDYNIFRQEASKYEYKLDIMIAARMSKFRESRSNIGYETARIMLLEENDPEIKDIYKRYKYYTAKYKGLEKVIEAKQGQISLVQSLIKNRRENA